MMEIYFLSGVILAYGVWQAVYNKNTLIKVTIGSFSNYFLCFLHYLFPSLCWENKNIFTMKNNSFKKAFQLFNTVYLSI